MYLALFLTGFALSGGQKQRVSLARAVYARKRIYVLDCPFSALDKTVRSQVWRKCVLGLLSKRAELAAPSHLDCPSSTSVSSLRSDSRFSASLDSHPVAVLSSPATVIIATHYGEELFLTSGEDCETDEYPAVDWVFELEGGRLTNQGTPRDVLGDGSISTTSADDGSKEVDSPVRADDATFGKNAVINANESEEAKATGAVAASVYWSYVAAAGRFLSAAILLSLFLMQASRNVSDWWLSYWVQHFSSDPDVNVTSVSPSSSISPSSWFMNGWRLGPMLASKGFLSFPIESHPRTYDSSINGSSTSSGLALTASFAFPTSGVACLLTVYAIIAAFNFLATLARSFLFAYGGIEAARKLHQRLLDKFFRAPLSYFSSTPAGRILNRFSSDLYTVDSSLPFILNIFLAQIFGVIGVIVVVCASLPLFLLFLIPLGIFYHRVQFYYRHTSREVKRLSSVTLSPIYAHFTASLEGSAVIRAMGEGTRFVRSNLARVEENARAQYAQLIVSQWLNFNLQGMGVVVMMGASLAAILERKYFHGNDDLASPALVGLAISYVLSVQDRLSGVVSSFTETEKEMIAVERVIDYVENIPVEEAEEREEEEDERRLSSRRRSMGGGRGRGTDGERRRRSGSSNRGARSRSVAFSSDYHWPSRGEIVFENVTLVYATPVGLSDSMADRDSITMMRALNEVSIAIRGGEKVLVVGRTGSGKSSLLTALMRLHPLAGGRILVDGVDLRHVPIDRLRKSIAVIPQDPLLFTGTVRQNLVPFDFGEDATKCAVDDTFIRPLLVQCRLDTLVDSLGGLDAPMQPGAFSLGQKQLFAAARAILRRCRILCLDEATAHLDSTTESLLQEALRIYAPDATLICISHRRGAELRADRTLVMSNGRVEAFE